MMGMINPSIFKRIVGSNFSIHIPYYISKNSLHFLLCISLVVMEVYIYHKGDIYRHAY